MLARCPISQEGWPQLPIKRSFIAFPKAVQGIGGVFTTLASGHGKLDTENQTYLATPSQTKLHFGRDTQKAVPKKLLKLQKTRPQNMCLVGAGIMWRTQSNPKTFADGACARLY
jgi:hypothetical protein